MAKRTAVVLIISRLALLLLLEPLAAAVKDPVRDGGQVVQEMKIEAPAMTEEDQHGYNMPRQYMCDACRAVVAHVNRTLVRKQPSTRRLKQWEYTEILDEVCATDFEGYGIKRAGGANKLSGPLLKERDEDQLQAGGASIQMGGDTWKKRMGEICRKIVYDSVGEEELYEHFRKHGEVQEDVCFSVTRHCKEGPVAAAAATPAKKKKEAAAAAPASSSSAGKKKKTSEDKKKTTLPSEKDDKGSRQQEAKKARKDAGAENKRLLSKEEKRTMKTGSKVPFSAAEKSGAPVDITYFLSELAVEHGLPPRDYTKNRSPKDWERTIVALAGKIFGKSAAKKKTAAAQEEEEEEAAAMET